MKPGIYYDMPAAEYHAAPGLSHSGMKHLAVSPLRYWHLKLNPIPPEESPSAYLDFGSALHCAVLEPEQFDRRYAQKIDANDFPGCLVTADDLKKWLGEKGLTKSGLKADLIDRVTAADSTVKILDVEQLTYAHLHRNKIILDKVDFERLAWCVEILRTNEAIQKILETGKSEVSIFANDPDTGVLLKCRIDWLAPHLDFDLKSFSQKLNKTIDDSIHDAIYYEKYHCQAYRYSFIRRLAFGESQFTPFIFGFIESDAPHEMRIKELNAKRGGSPNLFWETARLETQTLIRRYAECVERFGNEPWRDHGEMETLADEDIRQLAYA